MSSLQGKVIAYHLASLGARLSITDSSASGLETTTTKLTSQIGAENVLTRTADLRERTAVESWIADTVEHFRRLDGAVNTAGVHPHDSGKEPIWNISDEGWEFAQEVNVRGALNVKKDMETGLVMVFGSNASVRGSKNLASYTASKHVVLGVMRADAADAAGFNVRVNAVCPGPIDTPMLRNVVSESGIEAIKGRIPLGKLGSSKEIVGLVAYLLDDAAGFCTGGVHMVDGGLTIL
ncbi:hypothetical protein BDW74DRAFT_168144 [Aspergillus multicolor]|uniref:SDR family NAD(P)-dependent oxidoreductase n=1 Tax=Aspergillus multicolor TaxID=41759 RepID=UPI003CCD5A0F